MSDAGSVGLLLSHKSTLVLYADRYEIKVSGGEAPFPDAQRGCIHGFSRASRKRLFELLHEIEFERVTFVTLTYGADFPTDGREIKRHIKEYRRRVERAYGPVAGIWRLEFQRRGAAHFHIMYLDAPYMPVEDISSIWHSVIKSTQEAHLKNGVDIKLVTGRTQGRLIASYLAKYLAKAEGAPDCERITKVGRQWGRWNITREAPVEIEIETGQALDLYRGLFGDDGAYLPRADREPASYTVFGDSLGTCNFRRRVIDALLAIDRR